MASESGMLDNGQSAKELYRVDNLDLVQVPEEDYGKFYQGDDKKKFLRRFARSALRASFAPL